MINTNRTSRVVTVAVLLIGLVLPLAGCSDNSGRNSVDGIVTLDSQPLEAGSISFQPMPGTRAPSVGGWIVGGKFEITADKGLIPGKYRVTVFAYRKTGRFVNDPQMGKRAETSPVVFNEKGRLKVEVVADRKNQFEFALTTAR